MDDDAVVLGLQIAGYEADTIVLLELAPPVLGAWADGSTRERALILKIAAREHIAENSPAYVQLGRWA